MSPSDPSRGGRLVFWGGGRHCHGGPCFEETIFRSRTNAASYVNGVNLAVDGGWTAFGSYGDAFKVASAH